MQTKKNAVFAAVQEGLTTIRNIAATVGAPEPSVRRILGEGAKEGVYTRVERGVYILSSSQRDIAYVHNGDAVETLERLADEGVKVDMVFLDIPYHTPAVVGGNRGVKYATVSVEEFRLMMTSIARLVRSDDTPVYHMFSRAPSGLKAMERYNAVLAEFGFKTVAEGNYYKYQQDGVTPVRNMRGAVIPPEGIILATRSGRFNEKEAQRCLDFHVIRPQGYQTEKHPDMFASLVRQGTRPGDTILDPTAGGGGLGVAGILAGRLSILIEKSALAVDEFIRPRLEAAFSASPFAGEVAAA